MEAYCKRINRNCETPESTCLDCLLDKITDEIRQIVDEETEHDEKWAIGLRYAVKVIDKYRGNKE